MRAKARKTGTTLTEMTIVVAGIGLLAFLGLPGVRAFLRSFESEGGTRAKISAALASARAIAAKEQRYAGIRFQKAYNPADPDNAQYMVFIVQDPEIGAYGFGFRAVDGLEPIKLAEAVGVMDLTIVTDRNEQNPVNSAQVRLDEAVVTDALKDTLMGADLGRTDTTTFSIVFSPSGKLVIHGIQVRRRSDNDDVFNADLNIGMFYEDENGGVDLGAEPSRNSFIIYDRKEFRKAYDKVPSQGYSGYLVRLIPEKIYINPYTGTMISKD